jgi:hypothetical protein
MGVPASMSAQMLGSKCPCSQFSGCKKLSAQRSGHKRAQVQHARANAEVRAASVVLPASHIAASKAALQQLQSSSVSGSFDGGLNRESSNNLSTSLHHQPRIIT